MKLKSILCVSLVSIISANSYAFEIYKGRILEHKEWNTGNAKGVFKETNSQLINKLKNQMKLSGSKNGNSWTYGASIAEPTKGTVGTPVTLEGHHHINIQNDTNGSKKFNYTFSICAKTSEHTYDCSYYFDSIQLDEGGYIYIEQDSSLVDTFHQAGTYSNYVQTYLGSDDSGLNSSSTSSIEVSNSALSRG